MMQEKRDGGGGGGGGCCYFHPKEVVVGVCPLCLQEKLLHLLASSSSNQRHQYFPSPSKSIINIFTFPSLLNPLHFFHHSNSNLDHHGHDLDDLDTSTSQEDSFISMKIGDNGAGSWEDKNMNVPKKLVFLDHLHVSTKHKSQKVKEERESNKKSLVEHAKGSRSALRWRKRIGQAFQLVRWKRSNKANVWHVGTKVEGVKVMRKHKQRWIANLTKRKAK